MLELNSEIDSRALIGAIANTLQRIDARLINHGERVAFMACELFEELNLPFDEEKLFLLSVFHDIGAYKTDEIDRMVEFETVEVNNHSVYGYLFLKYMSPLDSVAAAVLYHHSPWDKLSGLPEDIKNYAALIHLCDRIDIAFLNKKENELEKMLTGEAARLFSPEYVSTVLNSFPGRRVFERLRDGSYRDTNENRMKNFHISEETVIEFIKMLVSTIDFRSEYTVTHTANTVAVANNIALHFGLDQAERLRIYLGALLHDVGKIAIPTEILENPGRLTDEQMKIMRTHVEKTEEIISGIVPKKICDIAVRHHERLDGSGYPHSLTAKDMDFCQRIVAVADIVSALVNKRSYKEPFPKERVIEIISGMRGNQLDEDICNYVCSEYDELQQATDNTRNEVITKYQAMLSEYNQLQTAAN